VAPQGSPGDNWSVPVRLPGPVAGPTMLPAGLGHPHASEEARKIAEEGMVLRVQVGSGLHGTSISGQDDRDEMGLCLEPPQFVTGLANGVSGLDASVRFEQYERHTAWDRPGGVANRSGAGDLDVIIYSARKWARLALERTPTGLNSSRSTATTPNMQCTPCGSWLPPYARPGNLSVVPSRLPVPLSVLDLCPVPTGGSTREALRRSVDLARHVERWGYSRYWVAEHHNMPGIASSAPAVLTGQIASSTSVIRVGSGGVMLPNHAPLTVAEQFGMLEAMYPGRIDLGIGRAPGTDRATARALRRGAEGLSAAGYASQVAELRAYFADRPAQDSPAQDHQAGQIRAIPAEGNEPAVWLLGSTGYSAEMAGLLGLPFAFAYHISAANARPALALYRRVFRPSARLAEPYCLISVSVLCAEDTEAARWRHGSTRLSTLRLRAGHPSTLPSPLEAADRAYSDAEQAVIAEATASHVVGDPATVAEQLGRLAETTGADELMLTTSTFAHADRLASYELLAPASGRGEQQASFAPAIVLEHVGHAGGPGQAADPAEGLR
jgi:luciferase family oxidoreductase group 1